MVVHGVSLKTTIFQTYKLKTPTSLQRPVRMDQNLRVPLDPLIELLVCSGRIINIDLMRHNEARFRLTRDNQISQIPIIRFHVTLAGTNRETL